MWEPLTRSTWAVDFDLTKASGYRRDAQGYQTMIAARNIARDDFDVPRTTRNTASLRAAP
jgi:hypothetical protein